MDLHPRNICKTPTQSSSTIMKQARLTKLLPPHVASLHHSLRQVVPACTLRRIVLVTQPSMQLTCSAVRRQKAASVVRFEWDDCIERSTHGTGTARKCTTHAQRIHTNPISYTYTCTTPQPPRPLSTIKTLHACMHICTRP